MNKRMVFAALFVAALAAGGLPAQITVPGSFPTIQLAIDNAPSGSTIMVAPGVYLEQLVVDPGDFYGAGAHGPPVLTIEATGPGVVVQLPASPRTLVPNYVSFTGTGGSLDVSLLVNNASVTVRDITFDGNNDMMPTFVRCAGIYARGATVNVQDCTIQDYQTTPAGGVEGGLGVWAEGVSTLVNVTGCTLSGIQKGHVVVNLGAEGNVSNSTLTGRGPTMTIAQNGVQFGYGGYGSVTGCTIDGFWWENTPYTSTGVLPYLPGTPITISNNTLRDCQTGILWQSDNVNPGTGFVTTISGNDFTVATTAAFGHDAMDMNDTTDGAITGNWSFLNNTINAQPDLGLFTNMGNGTISGNFFSSCEGTVLGTGNAQDDYDGTGLAAPNNWDGNGWSDFASNSGFPTTYDIQGDANAVDNSPSGDCPDFSGTNYAVGTDPAAVALVETSGDAFADIVTANSGSDDVTVLLNDGSGGFGPGSTVALTAGDDPRDVAGGNLFSGGGTDLAVACAGSDRVCLIDNSGGLTLSTILPTGGTRPIALCVADLDGFGLDDIAVAMEGDVLGSGAGLSVILNPVATPTVLPAPPGGFLPLTDIVCCDLDGDGDLDIAATMTGTVPLPSSTNNIILYENNGAGTYTYAGALSVVQNPNGLCCADLNGDGTADLAVTVESTPTPFPGGVVLFLNQGVTPGAWSPGTDFTATATSQCGQEPSAVACADLGDNGIPGFLSRVDVVTTNFNSISRFKDFGGTGFSATHSCSAGINPVDITTGELNADSTPDVVVANIGSNNVTVMLAVPQALSQNYGNGCPGTGGLIPQVSGLGIPVYGSNFAVELTNARPVSSAILGVSLAPQNLDLATGGCFLYVAPEITLIQVTTSGSGTFTLPFQVPADVFPASGLNAFWQWAIFDPNGAHLSTLSFSNALRTKFGN